MKVAITGAAGSVGRGVVDSALAAGHDVLVIDRIALEGSDVASVVVDTNDYSALAGALQGCDALIHLAAINGPGRHPDHVVHDNNVVSSYHALRAAVDAGISRISQASSVNAIGGRFSRSARYDYFPVDESHPSYAEDPYSLSKWICEQQAHAVARRFDGISIASLRLHGIVTSRADTLRWRSMDGIVEKQLWGYTTRDAAARAFLRGVTAPFDGHEVFHIVAPDTMMDAPSLELRDEHYPEVPLREELLGNSGFFDCRKASHLLGWTHDEG